MYDLFEHMNFSQEAGGRGRMGKQPTMMGKRGGKPSRKKATVSSQFKASSILCISLCSSLGQNPLFNCSIVFSCLCRNLSILL